MQPLTIGLLWHSLRSDNLGVGALTIAHIEILRSAARASGRQVSFHIIGFSGGGFYYSVPHVSVTETLISGPQDLLPGSPLWNALKTCNVILDIGAGDSFADIYGSKRFLWACATKEIAFRLGKPLVLSPQTIGPFNRKVYRMMAYSLMRRSTRAFVRDHESKVILDDAGLGHRAEETVDVAFRLPFAKAPRPPAGPTRFGLNVSGLLYAGGYTRDNQFGLKGNYKEFIAELVARLKQRDGIEITLVPHVIDASRKDRVNAGQHVEDDLTVSHEIANRFTGVQIAPIFQSPVEAKGFISGLHVLAGSRMHATIAAVSSGVATIPLAYSRKFKGVFDSVEYPLVGDLRVQDPSSLLDMTISALDKVGELSAAAERSSRIAQQKLTSYENFLVQLTQTGTG